MSSSSPPSTSSPFPLLRPADVLAFQFSSWYPTFASHSIKSTIIKPLLSEFQEYLHADGIFIPEGSENVPATSSFSDDDGAAASDDEEEGETHKQYAFPELDKQIRDVIEEYGAVFPKLNFSSPRDAVWLLPSSSPLKCTSPADVYLLLKPSDFINHDLDAEAVFEGCTPAPTEDEKKAYNLELVLRKWYPVDRGRELRCFVKDNQLIGICQRDANYYDFWNVESTQTQVRDAVRNFWETNIRLKWTATSDYVFDFLLTRDLSRGYILDFNPYAPKTDPLFFTYEELDSIHTQSLANPTSSSPTPVIRVIDSRSHPAVTSNAPAHQHNMVPVEALQMSSGRSIHDFADIWEESIKEAAAHDQPGEL